MKIIGSDRWEEIEHKVQYYMGECIDELAEDPNAKSIKISISSLRELSKLVLGEAETYAYDQALTNTRVEMLSVKQKILEARIERMKTEMKNEEEKENEDN